MLEVREMKLQSIDADDLFAEMFPRLATYLDNMHPVLAVYEALIAENNVQNELSSIAVTLSTLNEDEDKELSCLTFPYVYLILIIKDFFTVDAEEWFVK
jgi:hypothetical protein